ncbi:MAG: nucleoside hydrolase [Erysipelotrichaceae bacterium]|nr:nucleoside hydrolase [Erysipelotrichaceae bacterium]
MYKIIVDCDPGHDDIMALLTILAHDEAFKLLGICTVAGNNTLEKVTRNMLQVEEYLGIDIPVYMGMDKPLVKEAVPQPAGHGESGMDGPVLPQPEMKAQAQTAVKFYKEVLNQEDKVTIIALAPLTNLAVLLNEAPELKDKIAQIVLMGGAINGGNINKYAEFNIWHDPEAAKIVFDSGIRMIMAPLEVCYAGGIMIKEAERFKDRGKVSKLVDDLFSFYLRYAIERGWDKTAIFDLMPVVYLLKPEIFKGQEGKVDIILDGEDTQGQTIFEQGDGQHLVLLDTDREECMRIFFEAIDKLDERYV